ncbi:MAG: alanine dehydrogenase, partial [Flavisolibacter sp.]
MTRIGLLKEGKVPADNRVALTPAQCKWLQKTYPGLQFQVQSSTHRCFSDKEFERAGIPVVDDLDNCDILFGIKEVPVAYLLEGKTFLFFSHTRKKQLHNQRLLQAIIEKNITLIDYECMEHEDGQRIIGFGFFAGVVGAHNGMMAYGERTGLFHLDRV